MAPLTHILSISFTAPYLHLSVIHPWVDRRRSQMREAGDCMESDSSWRIQQRRLPGFPLLASPHFSSRRLRAQVTLHCPPFLGHGSVRDPLCCPWRISLLAMVGWPCVARPFLGHGPERNWPMVLSCLILHVPLCPFMFLYVPSCPIALVRLRCRCTSAPACTTPSSGSTPSTTTSWCPTLLWGQR